VVRVNLDLALRRPGRGEDNEELEGVVGRTHDLDEDELLEGIGGGGRDGGEPRERLRVCFVKHSARFLWIASAKAPVRCLAHATGSSEGGGGFDIIVMSDLRNNEQNLN